MPRSRRTFASRDPLNFTTVKYYILHHTNITTKKHWKDFQSVYFNYLTYFLSIFSTFSAAIIPNISEIMAAENVEKQDILNGPRVIWKILDVIWITFICRQKCFQNLSFIVLYSQQQSYGRLLLSNCLAFSNPFLISYLIL